MCHDWPRIAAVSSDKDDGKPELSDSRQMPMFPRSLRIGNRFRASVRPARRVAVCTSMGGIVVLQRTCSLDSPGRQSSRSPKSYAWARNTRRALCGQQVRRCSSAWEIIFTAGAADAGVSYCFGGIQDVREPQRRAFSDVASCVYVQILSAHPLARRTHILRYSRSAWSHPYISAPISSHPRPRRHWMNWGQS